MAFDPPPWIRPSAACCGGALACAVCAVWLAPPPCAAQSYVQVQSQTTLIASAPPDATECFDNGVTAGCPVTGTRYYDSGLVPGDHTFDAYDGWVIGRAQFVDTETRASTSLNGSAFYGRLQGSIFNQSFASGTFPDAAGGFAFGGEATTHLVVSFRDDLMLHGATPGGPISIHITQEIASSDLVLMFGSDKYPIADFCLANGDGTTGIAAFLDATHIPLTPGGPGGGEQSASYLRRTNECTAPLESGDPRTVIQINGTDGDLVMLSQTLTLDSYVYAGGGFGLPNRVILSRSIINAANSAHTYVEVLTPGGSFTSASGSLYQVPESGNGAGTLSADAALLVVLGLRRRRLALPPLARRPARPRSKA